MTCIVGIVRNGTVHMGADSLGVNGYLGKVQRKDPKVFINGEFLFGFTSSFRMGQLLAHAFTPPKRHADVDVYKFLVTDFINGVRTCLKDGSYTKVRDSVEIGGTFLLGYAGRLFRVESDFQVGEPADGFDACGCGEELALGAMLARSKDDVPATDILRAGLEAAEHFSAGVSAPFNFLSLPATKGASK